MDADGHTRDVVGNQHIGSGLVSDILDVTPRDVVDDFIEGVHQVVSISVMEGLSPFSVLLVGS
jgi:predicted ATP-grasp superfamily ATP-dependent carboligase